MNLTHSLANPFFAEELKQLIFTEETRHTTHINSINSYQLKLIENEEIFTKAFYIRAINNFQSFILLFDAIIIGEDMIEIDGKIYYILY